MPYFIPYLLAVTGGLLLPLAFSPHDHPWLAPFSLFLLFFAWRDSTKGKAFWLGYCFGLGQFGFGVSWIYNSLHNFGGASVVEAVGLLGLGVIFESLYPAFAGWLAILISRGLSPSYKNILVFPAVWVLIEWVRAWFIPGFPWLQVGSSQTDTPLGHGLAPLFGVYGVGFAVALLAGLTLNALTKQAMQRRVSLVALGGILLFSFYMAQMTWTKPAGQPFKVALLQGNVPQNQKWLPEFQRATLELYIGLTRKNWDAALVIWPETAVPAFHHQVQADFLDPLQAEAISHNTDLILGIPWMDTTSRQYYNAMISLGDNPSMYLKRHLVPFGEYLPFRPLLGWVLDILDIPLGDFARGENDQDPLFAAGYPLAASICYEDVFGHEARDAMPEAAYLVNVTNDAWFGHSSAPYQHVQMARMRSLESGRAMLRATNTGVTAIISPQGKILAQGPMFEQAVVRGEITPMRGSTPYLEYGDWVIITALLTLLLVARIKTATTNKENES